MLRISILFLFIILCHLNAWSTQAITRLNNGATSVPFDRFCSCNLLSNSSGKDVMIPNNIWAEKNSFMVNLPSGVTNDGACSAKEMGPFAATIDNISTTNCTATSSVGVISGVENNFTYEAMFDLSDTNFCSTCICRYRVNKGVWTSVNWKDNLIFCQNDRVEFDFSCPVGVNATTVIIDSIIFTVDVSPPFSCF